MNAQQIQFFKAPAIVNKMKKLGLAIDRIYADAHAIYFKQTPEQEFFDSLEELVDIMQEITPEEFAEIMENNVQGRIQTRKLASICQSLLSESGELPEKQITTEQ